MRRCLVALSDQREQPSSYARHYERWASLLRTHSGAVRALIWANRLIVWVFYGAYAVLLAVGVLGYFLGASTAAPFSFRLAALAALVLVSGAAFVLLSAVRARIDAPRPCERDGITPLVPRDGTGRSFPSRHAFSAFAIASCWWVACPAASVVLLGLACLLAIVRVLGGVHYPRDVAVGGLCGLAAGAAAAALAFFLGGGPLWP